jgi:two-component system, chemotaxis family, sensor histidine kinase and response regulator WspE
LNSKDLESLGHCSLLELFRMEIETQSAILTHGLITLEEDQNSAKLMEELMRAAHSAKGAARIVNRNAAVRIAHSMEDCFVAAQKGNGTIPAEKVDMLLRGVDLLSRISMVTDDSFAQWELEHEAEIGDFVASVACALEDSASPASSLTGAPAATSEATMTPGGHPDETESTPPIASRPESGAAPPTTADRVLRVGAENLNRLLGLAGEALVASRWLDSFAARMLRLKRLERDLGQAVENLRSSLLTASLDERAVGRLAEVQGRASTSQRFLADTIAELELFDRRFVNLSTRLCEEVLNSRMRPFAEGIQAFPRVVRDLARSLGKKAKLVTLGVNTTVDRDILEGIKAPLDHLLRNAVDHGLESPNERRLAGKPEEGVVQLEARHSAGALLVTVADDGRGIDPESVRAKIVERKLVNAETAQKMSEMELLEFLFLPGFTMKEMVTEISGRGVGLDVVQTIVKEVGGRVRVSSQPGQGTRFQMELPLTLSVIRALLADIGGEPYAFPLARIGKAVRLPEEQIESVEGRQHFTLGDHQIGLVPADQALELAEPQVLGDELSVIVLGDKTSRYGLVVDRFIGESELVVRTLDPRLGKVRNFSAAALMPDGAPVLIVDVEDLVRSIENLVSGQRLSQLRAGTLGGKEKKQKRILVVDDSLTVRELERKLLSGHGYHVDIAVDGMDGWNAVRTGHYDLILTDVDMPRLDGIELLTMIREDARLKPLPVAIVSYKDGEEDRQRGLEAGADYYLTKGSFQDETLIRAVADLIGGAGA